MKLYLASISILLLLGCNNSQKNKTHTQSKDSVIVKHSTIIKKSTINTENESPKKLMGYWALKGEQNSTFVIGKDSIYYTDQFKSYKYTIIQDSIRIYYDDFIGTYKYQFKINDTLVLFGDDGAQDYYRFSK